MKPFRIWTLTAIIGLLPFFVANPCPAAQGPIKIATISVQDILAASKAGKEAQKTIEGKASEYQAKFLKDQQQAEALRDEIEKKSSVWSEAVRGEKEREYQKKMRELQLKSEDARYELQQLQNQLMEPILKELQAIIADIGKKNGYTLIFENTRKGLLSRSGLLYADEALDISGQVQKELDSRLAKANK